MERILDTLHFFIIFWSRVHWHCHIISIYIFFVHPFRLEITPLRAPVNCDRSCEEVWFCGVSLYTWVKIYVHAILNLQILTYTCANILPRRRMLCVQACYLGDLETDWLSPL